MSSKVITRFPPSPTGLLHGGNYRTALFNYLFAKQKGGLFVVRIEDTDRARSTKENEENILETLAWLGLTADGEVTHSSERVGRHQELLTKIIAEGKAYVSKEQKKDGSGEEVEVVRLKNPGETVTFHDEIRGDITTDTGDLGDFVIARAIDDPLYHFAVVVDDGDMGVTHVIRGEDHISNTPRHILIQRALGFATPIYAHLPLVLGSDRTKLSKRRGAKALTTYRDMGVLPEAMLNYLALVGWHPHDDREYLSREELIHEFDLVRVQKGGAIFDETKLLSVNQHWMRALTDAEYVGRLNDFDQALDLSNIGKIVPLLKERAQTFGEAREMLTGELAFLSAPPAVTKEGLLAKEPAEHAGAAKNGLEGALKALEGLGSEVSAEAVKDTLMPLAEAAEQAGKGGRGAVLWALRYALSGAERSPDPFTIIFILGRDEAMSRLRHASVILEG